MKVPKLTKKAQDIVNQIMSADAVDIDHGRVDERVYYGQMHGRFREFALDNLVMAKLNGETLVLE